MPDLPPAGLRLPPFTYQALEQGEVAQRRLNVHTLQQFLRRAAAFVDYIDDVTLPIPGLGELVDLLAASPILLAGLMGAGEQLMRRNRHGAVVEIVGAVVEAAVTAIPGLELLDFATGPLLQKRTATLAREFVEARIAGDTPRNGWWTTTPEGQAYYIEPTGEDYLVSHYGPAEQLLPTPLVRVRYTKTGAATVWTPDTNRWMPITTEADPSPTHQL